MRRSSVLEIILTIVLVIALAAGGVMVYKYIKGKDKPVDPDPPTTNVYVPMDIDGNRLDLDKANILPKGIVYAPQSISTTSAVTYTPVQLTATVLPDTAIDKSLTWSVQWTDGSGDWTTGKTVTDYVTITPNADNDNIATCRILQAIGTQATITVTSNANSSVSATCTVDVAQRLNRTGVKYINGANVLQDWSSDSTSVLSMQILANAISYIPTYNYVSDNVYSLLDNYITTAEIYLNSIVWSSLTSSYGDWSIGLISCKQDVTNSLMLDTTTWHNVINNAQDNAELYSVLISNINRASKDIVISVKSVGKYSDITTKYYINLDLSNMGYNVESITISQSTIVQ